MKKRMRLVAWQVQPVVMIDDGISLSPVRVDPLIVPAADWETFKAGGDVAALEPMRKQIEAGTLPGMVVTAAKTDEGRVIVARGKRQGHRS